MKLVNCITKLCCQYYWITGAKWASRTLKHTALVKKLRNDYGNDMH